MSDLITRAAWGMIRRRVNDLVSRGMPPSQIVKALEILIEAITEDQKKK